MALVLCQISGGLRPSEVTASIIDFDGQQQFIPVDREFLSEIDGRWWMPIGLLRTDETNEAALIELPIEADSGANRLWVKMDNIYEPEATPA